MNRIKIIIALIFMAFMPSVLHAQWLPYYGWGLYPVDDTIALHQSDSIRVPKLQPHLSVSTGFMGSSLGDNRLYTSVAPSLVYHATDKLTVMGGFRITSDMGLNPNFNIGNSNQSLVPYKDRNGGTGLASAYLRAQYQVGENVWLAGSVYHMGGTYAPIYGPAVGNSFDVSTTAVSAEAAFRFSNNNFLHLSFTYIRDNYGTMPMMMHDAWMHCGGYCGPFGMYTSPYDYYHMASPYGSMLFGGF